MNNYFVINIIATFFGTVWFAAKIYRVGILMYGQKPSYKDLYKWLKYNSMSKIFNS